MKYFITLCLFTNLIIFDLFAAAPVWTVNETEYSQTMTITGIVSIGNNELNNADDMLAAFVGSECRGVTKLLYSEDFKRAFAYLMVMSNGDVTEIITFKVYNSKTGTITDIKDNKLFFSDASVGTQDFPYIFSDVSINEAAFTSFSFGITGEIDEINKESNTINVTLPSGDNNFNLPFSHTLSQGALIYVDSEPVYEFTAIDFSSPVKYTVVSQTGEEKVWTINVQYATEINKIEECVSDEFDIIVASNNIQFFNFPTGFICRIFDISGSLITNILDLQIITDVSNIKSDCFFAVVYDEKGKPLYSEIILNLN